MVTLEGFLARVGSYNAASDREKLTSAFRFCRGAHGGAQRMSGEPYYTHPIAVAWILSELHLDDATLVTALLHDTLEDTEVTEQDLRARFGDEIFRLVDGVTKLGKLEFASHEQVQAENFRKLLLATARDVRILLVKLADRLHNMRTLGALRPDKRRRIARETMEIYAPLADRMGIARMREELEDLAFAALNPGARMSILRRFVALKRERGDVIENISAALKAIVEEDGIECRIEGRGKMPYSVWRKMEEKRIAFEQLSDVAGFRLITRDEAECYRALGAVHRRWSIVMGRFKDYISSPKANGYRSIHTTVVGLGGMRVEIQIRSQAMHEVAETGVAAHWAYKDGVRVENPFAVDPFRWLRTLTRRLETGDTPRDFLKHFQLEMYADQVFCFTPRGDVISLPRGATPLDFAYAIHTEIGDRCVGAKIDGAKKPLWVRLRNGQQVEILCSEMQRPSQEWENWVVTGRARASINRALREAERIEYERLGQHLMNGIFEAAGHAPSDEAYRLAAEKLGFEKVEPLFERLGRGALAEKEIMRKLYPARARHPRAGGKGGRQRSSGVAGILAGRVVSFARCCGPLPDEGIVGVPRRGGGIDLHRRDCATLAERDDSAGWVHLDWVDLQPRPYYTTCIDVALAHVPGALGRLCGVIGEHNANIEDIVFVERRPDFFRTRIELAVTDTKHLESILVSTGRQKTVESVRRVGMAHSALPRERRRVEDAAGHERAIMAGSKRV